MRAFLDTYRNAHYDDVRFFVTGNRGAAEWTFSGTDEDGKRVVYRGSDLFEFEGERIASRMPSARSGRRPSAREVSVRLWETARHHRYLTCEDYWNDSLVSTRSLRKRRKIERPENVGR